MAETTQAEKTIKELFVGVCWKYLHDNFHKFNEANKIKIALTLAQKNMPTELTGNVVVNQLPTVKVNGVPLAVDIGEPPGDTVA